jgi:hypothetical protein
MAAPTSGSPATMDALSTPAHTEQPAVHAVSCAWPGEWAAVRGNPWMMQLLIWLEAIPYVNTALLCGEHAAAMCMQTTVLAVCAPGTLRVSRPWP